MWKAQGESYWLEQLQAYPAHLIVVGAGITGLSAAYFVKRQRPLWRVVVVEKGHYSAGASVRNAGFACMGSPGELAQDLLTLGWRDTLTLFTERWQGLLRLRQLVGDAAIGYQPGDSFEIFLPHQRDEWQAIQEFIPKWNASLQEHIYSLGTSVLSLYKQQCRGEAAFVVQPQVKGLENILGGVELRGEGRLHPGKLIDALTRICRKSGVEIWYQQEICGQQWQNDLWQMQRQGQPPLYTERLLHCTNGYAPVAGITAEELYPARNQVLLTTPMAHVGLKGSYHLEQGHFYFREIDGRILVGGGRHLGGTTEETEQHGITPGVQARLEELLQNVILPGQAYTVERRWSGILGLGAVRKPLLRKLEPRRYAALRLGGMGVAIGCRTGEQAAELLVGDTEQAASQD